MRMTCRLPWRPRGMRRGAAPATRPPGGARPCQACWVEKAGRLNIRVVGAGRRALGILRAPNLLPLPLRCCCRPKRAAANSDEEWAGGSEDDDEEYRPGSAASGKRSGRRTALAEVSPRVHRAGERSTAGSAHGRSAGASHCLACRRAVRPGAQEWRGANCLLSCLLCLRLPWPLPQDWDEPERTPAEVARFLQNKRVGGRAQQPAIHQQQPHASALRTLAPDCAAGVRALQCHAAPRCTHHLVGPALMAESQLGPQLACEKRVPLDEHPAAAPFSRRCRTGCASTWRAGLVRRGRSWRP